MKELIDKAALVAEIEKLKIYLQIPNTHLDAKKVCDNVISVINTLEVKEVEEPNAMDNMSYRYFPTDFSSYEEYVKYVKDNLWECSGWIPNSSTLFGSEEIGLECGDESPLDAAFELVCWLKENNKL